MGFAMESLGCLHTLHSFKSCLQTDFGVDKLDSFPEKLNSSGGSHSEPMPDNWGTLRSHGGKSLNLKQNPQSSHSANMKNIITSVVLAPVVRTCCQIRCLRVDIQK